MAEAKVAPVTIAWQGTIAAGHQKPTVDTHKDNDIHSSNASTVASASDDSDSGASKATPKKNEPSDIGAAKATKKIKAPRANDEPMKVEVRSWPNANHPEIQNILAVQKLEEELGQNLHRMVVELQEAQMAANTAWYEQIALREQQMYWSQPMFDPAFGYNHVDNQCCGSPLMPPALAQLANDAPPLPSYLPSHANLDHTAAQWRSPQTQRVTSMNKNAKPSVMTKKADKATKSMVAAAETSPSDAAKEDGDMEAVGRTVVATKINRLGFSAEKVLADYFVQFGEIDHVCVPQKIKRPQGGSPAQGHLRPSGLGFVVMKTEEGAEAILAEGADHTVCGKLINVRAFKKGQNGSAAGLAED